MPWLVLAALTAAALFTVRSAAAPSGQPRPTFPLKGSWTVRSPYGWRLHPCAANPKCGDAILPAGTRKFHDGIDVAAPTGTPVYAPLAGVVSHVDLDGVGRGETNGNAIFLTVAGGYRWCFLHLSAFAVPKGATVAQGTLLGLVGATGRATGPHLHLQVYDPAGKTVDPLDFFRQNTLT